MESCNIKLAFFVVSALSFCRIARYAPSLQNRTV